MSVTLLYHSSSVGPVCKRLVAASSGKLSIQADNGAAIKTADVLIRWDSKAPAKAKLVVNEAEVIALVRDKIVSRKALGDLAPPSHFGAVGRSDLPVIIRPRRHHAARKFFVCRTMEEAKRAIRACPLGWYASALIDKQAEYRIFILHNYVVAVSQRFPADENQVAWNLAAGGKLINVRKKDWPIAAIKVAIKAHSTLGLDWSAMDVGVDREGKVYVFEANTAPGLRNPFTLGQIAKAFVSLGQVGIPEPPNLEKAKTWKTLRHPALR